MFMPAYCLFVLVFSAVITSGFDVFT